MRQIDSIVIMQVPTHDCFADIGLALNEAGKELGMIPHDQKPIYQPPEAPFTTKCPLVLGGNTAPNAAYPGGSIHYNLEQTTAPWFTPAYINLLKSYPILDYSYQNMEKMYSKFGIVAAFCGIGYHRILQSHTPETKKDIDILLLGSMCQRRHNTLTELRRFCKVETPFPSYGEDRAQYIARSKIVINIHYYSAKVLEMARISYLLANQACVVSEESPDCMPLTSMVRFAHYDNLPNVCLSMLPFDLWKTQAERGFREFSQMPSQTAYLAEALGKL